VLAEERTNGSGYDLTTRRIIGTSFGLIHVDALAIFVPALFAWSSVAVAIAFYAMTGMAITLGYHRLLTHRSFKLAKPLEYAVAVLAVLALQGGPISWVAVHRAHTDQEGDPHNSTRGMPSAHFKWLVLPNEFVVQESKFNRWAPELTRIRSTDS
jgi:fatty-acid desaturase